MATSNWKYADILADQRLEMLQDGNKELYDEEMERTRKVIESRLELGLDIDEQLAWADKVGYNYNLHNASVAGIDPENVSKTGYSDKLLAKVGKDDKSLISPSTKTLSENKPLTDSQITLGLIENSQKAAQNQKDNQYAQYQNYQKQLESMYEEYKKNAKNQAEQRLPFLKESLINSGANLSGGKSITEQLKLQQQLNEILAQYDMQKRNELADAYLNLTQNYANIDSELAQNISQELYRYNALLNEKNALEYQKERDSINDMKWYRELELEKEQNANEYERWLREFEADQKNAENNYRLNLQNMANENAQWKAELEYQKEKLSKDESTEKYESYVSFIKWMMGQSEFDHEKGTYVRKYTDADLAKWIDSLPLSDYEKKLIASIAGMGVSDIA